MCYYEICEHKKRRIRVKTIILLFTYLSHYKNMRYCSERF